MNADVTFRAEHQWIPVTESGDRWAPRSKEEAERALIEVPVGGLWLTGEPWDGVARIEHQVRYVTEWVTVQ